MEKIKNTCFLCWVDSHEKVLVKIEKDWEDTFVCTWCLPSVIHW